VSAALEICERVRALVSLDLDGELSELESAIVEAHLEDCRACRAHRARVATTTYVMRSAPLEPLPRPIRLPARRRLVRPAVLSSAAAAAVAAAAALAIVNVATPPNSGGPHNGLVSAKYLVNGSDNWRETRRQLQKAQGPLEPAPAAPRDRRRSISY
jgi:hypothetical protein